MLQQGVSPINKAQNHPRPNGSTPTRPNSHVTVEVKRNPVQPQESNGVAWQSGENARKLFENALELARKDRMAGHQTWMTGLRENGRATWLNERDSVARILAFADRERLRVIIIGGKGWTCIMHPKMGIATIEIDPGRE